MKSAGRLVLLSVTAVVLAGCGTSMRSYLEKDTPTQTAAMRSDLTMPPDLRLPQPGTTAAAPDPGAAAAAAAASTSTAALTAPPPPARVASAPATGAGAAATTAPASGPDSVYTNAGISLYKADGTKKSDAELRQELQAYYLAQKKAKNPNYGTVFNIGNIFKDE